MTADSLKKKPPRKVVPAGLRQPAEPAEARDGGFRASHLFVMLTMIAAGGGVVTAAGAPVAHLAFVSLAIGSVGVASYTLYRAVWPLVAASEDGESESAGERARAERERDRAATQRAIKDLEFDRAMGKLSEADFQEMQAQLEFRTGYRDLIERDLAAAAGSAGSEPLTARPGAAAGADAAARVASPQDLRPAPRACGSCGTSNDTDAQFCKQCGNRLFE